MTGESLSSMLEEIGARLKTAGRILLISHLRPDGDAIGCLLGLGLSLQAAGKDVQMVLNDGVPSSFRHLPGREQVLNHPAREFELSCVLDCSDLSRIGEVLEAGVIPDINIDHHITNMNFARLNLVDTQAVATAEILAELITSQDLPMTRPVASNLLTGMVIDSIGFRTSNMTPRALRRAAELMEHGADLPELYQRGLVHKSFEAARFWGAGLTLLQREGRLVWTVLTLADRRAVGYSGRDDADLVNLLSSIDGADIAVIFVEQPNGHVKVSWRATPGYDVAQLALQFGGGGHAAASGAEIPGTLTEVQPKVLQATQVVLDSRQNGLHI